MAKGASQKILGVLAALLLAVRIGGSAHAAPLRVLCFNVQNGLYSAGDPSYQEPASILKRIDADVVGLCELMIYDPNSRRWVLDDTNFPALATELGLPYHATEPDPGIHFAGIASRYPIEQVIWIDGLAMTRRIPLARIAVPETSRRVWVAMLHLKARHTSDLDQHIRAAELSYLRNAVLANCDLENDLVILMGDFNLVSPGDRVFYDMRYSDVQYPLDAPRDADGYFVPESIFKVGAFHAGSGGETWTWRSDGIFPNGALDHIMVNETARTLGVVAEVYDVQKDTAGIEGLAKYGPRPPAGAGYGSDHLPVFADLNLTQSPTIPAQLVIEDARALNGETPAGGPLQSQTGCYVLRNSGTELLEWEAATVAPWISLSPTSGTLQPGGRIAVRAETTTEATTLPVGRNVASLSFTNRTNGLGSGQSEASLFVGPFVMDGAPDSAGYILSREDLGLYVALRGTRLYVAVRAPVASEMSPDHHILITDTLLEDARTPAPWAKRGRTAAAPNTPYLAAEGSNTWSGWFNAPPDSPLQRSLFTSGVLEGSLDLVEAFGTVPELLYLAAVAYDTRDASSGNPLAGRIVGQIPAAVVADDDITPGEFLKIPLHSVTDTAADGRYDIVARGRRLSARMERKEQGRFALTWPTAPGRAYRLWKTQNLAPPAWEAIATVTAGPSDWELAHEVEAASRDGNGAAFYKIEALPEAE
jgi:endonuclease/exonuclease/phosphatase family metal-dependent hydrolase